MKSHIQNKIKFEFINDESVRFSNNKSFDDIMYCLFERENDKSQIDAALSIYNKVLKNIDSLVETEYEGYPTYDLSLILNEPFIVIFAGNKLGTLTLDINGIKTLTLVVGSDIYDYSLKNNNFYKFWVNFKSFIIHELVHLNDYKRVKVIKKSDLTNANTYYNNPLEFNAYYLEIAFTIYNTLKSNPETKRHILKNRNIFLEYSWNIINEIVPGIKKYLSKEMLFKWNKRLYQLFDELKGTK